MLPGIRSEAIPPKQTHRTSRTYIPSAPDLLSEALNSEEVEEFDKDRSLAQVEVDLPFSGVWPATGPRTRPGKGGGVRNPPTLRPPPGRRLSPVSAVAPFAQGRNRCAKSCGELRRRLLVIGDLESLGIGGPLHGQPDLRVGIVLVAKELRERTPGLGVQGRIVQ